MPVPLMATMALTGSLAASLLAQAPGTRAGMDARGVGAGAIRGAAGAGARILTMDVVTMADTGAGTPAAIAVDSAPDTGMAELMDAHL